MTFRNDVSSSATTLEGNATHYSSRAVERVLQVLSSFGHGQLKLTYHEVSEKTHLPPSTVFKLMQILVDKGFLERNGDSGQYGVGSELFRLGALYSRDRPLVEVASPVLQGLADQRVLLASLAIRHQDTVLLLLSKQGTNALSFAKHEAGPAPLYLSSLGKALMLDLPDEELERLSYQFLIPGPTPKSFTNTAQLREDLQRARANGYTVDDEAVYIGVYCIGAPIRDHRGTIVAAISVTGVKAAIIDHVPEIGSQVCNAAAAISRSLGVTS